MEKKIMGKLACTIKTLKYPLFYCRRALGSRACLHRF